MKNALLSPGHKGPLRGMYTARYIYLNRYICIDLGSIETSPRRPPRASIFKQRRSAAPPQNATGMGRNFPANRNFCGESQATDRDARWNGVTFQLEIAAGVLQ
jgi:hypothetical protein